MRFFSRSRSHDDFTDEVRAHLDLETERLIAEGLSAEEARAAAHRAFGNVTAATERFYETSRWIWLDQLGQDIRYAWRGMRRSPAFVATAVSTLAVGLGLLTVAFTIVNAYVLRPFAIRDPGSLHQIVWHARDDGGQGFRWRDYDELSGRTDLFHAVIGERTRFVSSNGRPLWAAVVSPNYFDALGPAMQVGRGLGRADVDTTGHALVLSHQAWVRLYAADPAAVGRDLEINGRLFTIVGVLAPAFTGLGDLPRDVFVLQASDWPNGPGSKEIRETEITVRLRPGVTAAQAAAALGPTMNRWVADHQAVTAEVRPQPSANPPSFELLAKLAPMFAAFVLVLLTCCANVSNVMLARALVRERELAVRLSIGASRGRVVRQLLTEGLLIALLAGAAGLAVAAWGLRLALAVVFSTLPASVARLLRIVPLTFDLRVFLFAFAAAAAATLAFALMPALQASRMSLVDELRGQSGAARRGSRLRNGLVIAQVVVAMVLAVAATTIARSGAAVGAVDLGYATDRVVSVNIRGEQDQLAQPLAAALAADPRVAAVAVTSGNPLFNPGRTIAAAGSTPGTTARTLATFVSPEFFSILRIPIAQGRAFRADEAQSAARVAIVSVATAGTMWPGQDPIGKTIRIERANGRRLDELPDYPEVTVIGTVADVIMGIVAAGHDHGHIYLPIDARDPHASAILLRSRTDRDLDAAALEPTFRRVAPDAQLFEVLPLAEMRALQTYPLLAASWVAWLLGGVALVLSVSGLYGVLACMLTQRTREFGIRMALGASARAVVSLVLKQSARLAGIGGVAGLATAFTVLKVLDSAIHLELISLVDARAYAGGAALVVAATLFAAYQPARRAARIDPAETLRTD